MKKKKKETFNSFHPCNSPIREVSLSFYRWGNWVSELRHSLPQEIQWLSGRSGFKSRPSASWIHVELLTTASSDGATRDLKHDASSRTSHFAWWFGRKTLSNLTDKFPNTLFLYPDKHELVTGVQGKMCMHFSGKNFVMTLTKIVSFF